MTASYGWIEDLNSESLEAASSRSLRAASSYLHIILNCQCSGNIDAMQDSVDEWVCCKIVN